MIEREERKEKKGEIFNSDLDTYQQLGRNLKGFGLERDGHINRAIELYEQNVQENFYGAYPYERLSRIYRAREQIDDEIRVLEKVVWILENIIFEGQEDRLAELERFKMRLEEAKKLRFEGQF